MSIQWALDGKGMYVGLLPAIGGTLFYVDLERHSSDVLRQLKNPFNWYIQGVPSPDGRYLAVSGTIQNSNIWMLEDF